MEEERTVRRAESRALMACRLVALDKSPGVRPVGIGGTLLRALAKLVMKAVGDQTKMVGGNLQLCAGLEAGIEGVTHAVGGRHRDRKYGGMEETEEGGEAYEGVIDARQGRGEGLTVEIGETVGTSPNGYIRSVPLPQI